MKISPRYMHKWRKALRSLKTRFIKTFRTMNIYVKIRKVSFSYYVSDRTPLPSEQG